MIQKFLEIAYNVMMTGVMVLVGSICITLAIVVPFAMFGGLHSIFCK